jgi:predicted phosphohydrolase
MKVWAIADLHLSFGVPNKEMGVFGKKWQNHAEKIKKNWVEKIHEEDLVLIAGDISWALHLEDALVDLRWISDLPGTKVISKGNHDLWWKSLAKMNPVLPPRTHLIHNNAFTFQGVSICGTRLWDHNDNDFAEFIEFREVPKNVNVHLKTHTEDDIAHDEKIYKSEIERLKLSLKCLDPNAHTKIAMIHYPPIGKINRDTEVTKLLEEFKVNICVYGHLHNLRDNAPVNIEHNSIQYICTSCDFLNFVPVLLLE